MKIFFIKFALLVVFYLLVLPIGLVQRIFGIDHLNRKIEKTKKTYWDS